MYGPFSMSPVFLTPTSKPCPRRLWRTLLVGFHISWNGVQRIQPSVSKQTWLQLPSISQSSIWKLTPNSFVQPHALRHYCYIRSWGFFTHIGDGINKANFCSKKSVISKFDKFSANQILLISGGIRLLQALL